MKNNETSFTIRTIIFWCVIVIAILVLAFVIAGTADAKSINQREWLLEYEQTSGYPAPGEEPTTTYTSGYPAPGEEPTATAKPKKQVLTPVPTIDPSFWDSFCEMLFDMSWWDNSRCIDSSTATPRPIPTLAPTMEPSP